MNRFALTITFALSFVFFKAQDSIVKRNGERTVAKVTEVNPTNIRYKRFDNPEGPLYTINKEEVNYVLYFNGTKDMFATYVHPLIQGENTPTDLTIQTAGRYYYYKTFRITEPDMHAVIKRQQDAKLNAMVKSVENKKFVQDVLTIVSIPVFFSGLYTYEKNKPVRGRRGAPQAANLTAQKNGIALMLGALACDAVSISFMLDRRIHNRMIINAYNKKITLGDH